MWCRISLACGTQSLRLGLSPPAWRVLLAIVLMVLLGAAAGMARLANGTFGWSCSTWLVASLAILLLTVTALYYLLRTKFVTGLDEYRWYQTLHLMSFKMAFFDRSLNIKVRYARHALALDERRADFDRVPWVNDAEPPTRCEGEGPWFEQKWFAGNHSDIGGSYPENEFPPIRYRSWLACLRSGESRTADRPALPQAVRSAHGATA